MKKALKILPLVVLIVANLGCNNDNDDSPSGLEARLQGTWSSTATIYQYLDVQGIIVEETPNPNGEIGEIGFNNGTFTLVEPGFPPYSYSGTYRTNQVAGKDFLILTSDGESLTIEVQFPSNNRLILIWGDGRVFGDPPKHSFRNHVSFIKR